MLVPIAQAIWQQVGPQIQQIVTSPAFTQFIQQVLTHPVARSTVIRGVAYLTENASEWYASLPSEDKQRLHRSIAWVVKDTAGDLAALATGLPIGPLVDLAVGKVLDKLGHGENASAAEVTFIRSELLRQLNKS